MNISPYFDHSLKDLSDNLGSMSKAEVEENLVSIIIVLCKRIDYLEKNMFVLKRIKKP